MSSNQMTRREFVRQQLAGAAGLALGAGAGFACRRTRGRDTGTRMIVLGLDGMDPTLAGRMMAEGRLPTFAKVARDGHFGRLGTSTPPQSPVAWCNFITGTNPGGHGIFDFLHRDPETYLPFASTARTEAPTRSLAIGDYILPLSEGRVVDLRHGRAFWEILEEHAVPATVFKMPSSFPPSPGRQRTLSGMGTPDLLGTPGLFSFYSDQPTSIDMDLGGGTVHQVTMVDDGFVAPLRGPVNTLRQGSPESSLELRVFRDAQQRAAKIVVADQELLLNEGEWSPWVRLSFPMIPGVSVSGICRLYLKQVHPGFQLYVSPIEIDPADPALPISTPESYARELAERFGPFHTKGLPADTKALAQGLLSDGEFLAQDEHILQEKLAIYDYELARFESGLLFCYISSTDQRSHMFWRLTDPQHPAYDARAARDYASVIEDTYVQMDRMLARTMAKVDSRTHLMVLSDHGFSPYYRSFNLNTWLLEQGFAALKDPAAQGERELLQNVDWTRSKAYAIGFNALYVNQRGREARGIVSISDKRALVEDLATRLEAVRDPLTGERVVLTAARSSQCYSGPYCSAAPDIVVGYNRGYRASWQTALGKFPRELLFTNDSKWSGDHLMAASALSGLLLTNRPLRDASGATLCDLTATVLAAFGIETPSEMQGRALV